MGEVIANPKAIADIKNDIANFWYITVTPDYAINGNTDINLTVPMPTGINHNQVTMVIFGGYTPSSAWTTSAVCKYVQHDTDGWKAGIRTIGSTNQNYTFRWHLFVGNR